MSKTVVLKPRMSEKTYSQSQSGTYTFQVPSTSNKHEVARAVEQQFDVTVTNVNIAVSKGKAKRSVRKGGRAIMGKRNDVKKAYVTLKEGDAIPVFAAVEEAEGNDKPAKKEAK